MSARMTYALAGTAIMALVASMPAAATIAVSSQISLQADADADNSTPVTDTNSVAQGNTVNPLGPISVLATSSQGNALAQALATVGSTWVDPSRGQVRFEDVGFITRDVTGGSADTFSGLDWEYVFIATATGQFDLAWDISRDARTTDAFGLNGITFEWSGPGGNDFLDLDTVGALSRNIVAGQQYTFGLRNVSNIFGQLGTRTALMDADISWRMPSAVPEPSTVMLLALSMLGIGIRRRTA